MSGDARHAACVRRDGERPARAGPACRGRAGGDQHDVLRAGDGSAPRPGGERRHHGADDGRGRGRLRDGGVPSDRAFALAVHGGAPVRAAQARLRLPGARRHVRRRRRLLRLRVGGRDPPCAGRCRRDARRSPGWRCWSRGTATRSTQLLRPTYANGRPTYLRASMPTNAEAHEVAPGPDRGRPARRRRDGGRVRTDARPDARGVRGARRHGRLRDEPAPVRARRAASRSRARRRRWSRSSRSTRGRPRRW